MSFQPPNDYIDRECAAINQISPWELGYINGFKQALIYLNDMSLFKVADELVQRELDRRAGIRKNANPNPKP